MRNTGRDPLSCDAPRDVELINDIVERSIVSHLSASMQHEIRHSLLPRMSAALLLRNIYTLRIKKCNFFYITPVFLGFLLFVPMETEVNSYKIYNFTLTVSSIMPLWPVWLNGSLPGNSLAQAAHTHVPLSPSSTIWYRPRGGDALRLGR